MSKGNKNGFIKYGVFTCECGKVYEKSQSLYAHQGRCKIHLGDRYDPDKHRGWNTGDARAWSRGLTKETNESIKRIGEINSERLKNLGENNPLCKWNKNKPKESYDKQSRTRKDRYKNGQLIPALGVGRGKYSSIVFKDKKYTFRSTYEFIYALWLIYNNIEFEYESVKVTVNDRTYFSDFLINNKIVEIKGFEYYDHNIQKEAFEKEGYDYEIKYEEDINKCYEELNEYLNMEEIINDIVSGNNNKNYYEYVVK